MNTIDGSNLNQHILSQIDWAMATKDQLLEELVRLDCVRWGISEESASRARYRALSRGLLLNSLAHRQELGFGECAPQTLLMASKAALTRADKAFLRKGG
jgi:hypothetical protein